MDSTDLVNFLKKEGVREALTELAIRDPMLYLNLTGGGLVDGQTGLLSKYALEEILLDDHIHAAEIAHPDSAYTFSYVVLDIDDFKDVNTKYLWKTGDEVIAYVAKKIVESTRLKNPDLEDPRRRVHTSHDHLGYSGRVGGGEEFGILLPWCDATKADDITNRIRLNIAGGIPSSGHPGLRVTVSGGGAVYQPGMTRTDMISSAQEALAVAKNTGKDRLLIQVPNISIGGITEIKAYS